MARKKATHSRRRRTRRTAAAAPSYSRSAPRRKHARKRTYHRRKKGLLSSAFSPASAKNGAMQLIYGIAGALILDQGVKLLIPNMKKAGKIAIMGGAAFLTASILKMPAVAAGMAGVAGIRLMEPDTLSEGGDFTDYDNLDQLPEVLDESYLMESPYPDMLSAGQGYYLQESYLMEDMSLQG